MLRKIDTFLDSITMYRLVLYGLFVLILISYILSFFNLLPFSVIDITLNLAVILVVCYLTNKIFALIFRTTTNYESFFITALILELILLQKSDLTNLSISALAGFVAIASKYVLAINKKHLFNPAGVALVALGLMGMGNAFWWVGSFNLMPFTIILSLLVIRKLRRFHMTIPFIICAVLVSSIFNLKNDLSLIHSIAFMFGSGPIIFFAGIMLTEPLTSPGIKKNRIVYGALTGLLYGSQFSLGPLYSSPELALILGNLFSYIVSPKQKLFLNLQKNLKIAPDIYDFIFENKNKFYFKPGQYLEWTVGHKNVDSRGNRRYFTIASSPTEETIRLGVKINQEASSSFKIALMNLPQKGQIIATQLAGDFVLPEDAGLKLAFIAGGIGITPFRSILKYLVDTNQMRDIVLIYNVSTSDNFVYKDILTQAQSKLGIKVIYNATDKDGHMDHKILALKVPDFKERTFYISGSHGVVVAFEDMLKNLKVPQKQVVTDYFPGY